MQVMSLALHWLSHFFFKALEKKQTSITIKTIQCWFFLIIHWLLTLFFLEHPSILFSAHQEPKTKQIYFFPSHPRQKRVCVDLFLS